MKKSFLTKTQRNVKVSGVCFFKETSKYLVLSKLQMILVDRHMLLKAEKSETSAVDKYFHEKRFQGKLIVKFWSKNVY